MASNDDKLKHTPPTSQACEERGVLADRAIGSMILDAVLIALLVIALPGYMLWRSLRTTPARTLSTNERYIQTMVAAVVLDGGVALDWLITGRSAATLGLGAIGRGGAIGLGIAALVAVGASLMSLIKPKKGQSKTELDAEAMFPTTRNGLAIFVVFSLVIGFSWELLYRGFLLAALTPGVGLIASLLIAGAAYGIAHGFKTLRLFAASLAAAFIFVSAYALTKSLWWLIIIHCGLPLFGAAFILNKRTKENRALLAPSAR